MGGEAELSALDPRYRTMLRLRGAILALMLLGAALAGELTEVAPTGVFLVPAALLALWLAVIAPARRFSRWGYRLDPDRLRIVSGYLFHRDTVVPLGRVQHIDVDQGPLMRRYGLATLTVHTAGNANASVALPGLARGDALAMREAIRTHIKQARA